MKRNIPNTLLYWLVCIISTALVTCSSSINAMEEMNVEGHWQPVGFTDTVSILTGKGCW